MTSSLTIINPKRRKSEDNHRAAWYPYYAGFSADFATAFLESAAPCPETVVADPWNGAGTTTWAASCEGFRSLGIDLNPVMVIAAKARQARCVAPGGIRSLISLCKEHVAQLEWDPADPLAVFFESGTGSVLRSIEGNLRRLYLPGAPTGAALSPSLISTLSSDAAAAYLALFRLARELITPFLSSNPTWVRKPRDSGELVRVPVREVLKGFATHLAWMREEVRSAELLELAPADIRVSSSTKLPFDDQSVGCILTSPPYCTRIDYAVSTLVELLILGYAPDDEFRTLRRQLIGTTTVESSPPVPCERWGPTCLAFLRALRAHDSKASKTYYLKTHLQYFSGIFESLREIRRLLIDEGICAIVVQDSYYKDVHNDLPQIVTEMAEAVGLIPTSRRDFQVTTNIGRINRSSRLYRKDFKATESVLCFEKNGKVR